MGDLLDGVEPPVLRGAGDVAVEIIRNAILAGKLAPGERLGEGRLARDLGISRTPVREALRVLQSEGLVTYTRYQGARVYAYDTNDLDDMYQLRAVLEGYGARRAAERIGDDGLEQLEASCDRLAALESSAVSDLVEENLLFHNTILAAAASERLLEMVRKVVDLPLVYKTFIWSEDQKRRSEDDHRRLTAALEDRDGALAERLMMEHIDAARLNLIAASAAEEQAPVHEAPSAANLGEMSDA